MGNVYQCFTWLTVAYIVFFAMFSNCDTNTTSQMGTTTCKNGAWRPDTKMLTFGLSCPLPLDGKWKSKAKTALCGMKKTGIYDADTKTVHPDKFATVLCPTITQEDLVKDCNENMKKCLKDDGKGYFKDPKEDKNYKTWIPFLECLEKWAKQACHK